MPTLYLSSPGAPPIASARILLDRKQSARNKDRATGDKDVQGEIMIKAPSQPEEIEGLHKHVWRQYHYYENMVLN